MPFRARFDCLWCGTDWTTRGSSDLEGWAQLCPACLAKAGSNGFLRDRLRSAITERGAAPAADRPRNAVPPANDPAAAVAATVEGPPADFSTRAGRLRGPAADATAPPRAFPDDWYLRRGEFARGAVHDAAWAAELDAVTRWLDAQPLGGRILEPAAGVGFFSPLLAEKGELHASDPDGSALDRARDRLVAHRLLAHLHVGDPWSEPDSTGDALVAAFLVGRVRGAGLEPALGSLRRRLRASAPLALIDLRPDTAGGPPPGTPWAFHSPDVLEAALARSGFDRIEITTTGRFFVLVAGRAV